MKERKKERKREKESFSVRGETTRHVCHPAGSCVKHKHGVSTSLKIKLIMTIMFDPTNTTGCFLKGLLIVFIIFAVAVKPIMRTVPPFAVS